MSQHEEVMAAIGKIDAKVTDVQRILNGNGTLGLVGRTIVLEGQVAEHIGMHAQVKGGLWQVASRVIVWIITGGIGALVALAVKCGFTSP